MEEKRKGFLNHFTLKIIAIVSMVIDHIGYVFFSSQSAFRAIGRISFPIFCFLIVEGFFYTRNHLNYLIRLAIFAILSEIPFDLAFRHTLFDWQHQNVFITLSLGLISIFCIEEMNKYRRFIFPLFLTWAAAYFAHCDYGLGGVLLICMFYTTKNSPGTRLILCALILYVFFGTFELYGLFALIPIALYNGEHGPNAKMIFYWFYPLHLLILFTLSLYLL